MKDNIRSLKRGTAILLLAVLFSVQLYTLVLADPAGASITYNATSTATSASPQNRSDPRGTITTLVLNAVQQDQFWKAYVGNVTGVLTLDDANGFTIYDWSLTNVTITGEVYASRASGPSFTTVICANGTVISSEQTFNNMTASQVDNINNTFDDTTHASFFVGSTQITNSTCPAGRTYLNDSAQTADENNSFQQILLADDSANMIYVTLIENNTLGYNNRNYDFQMLVAESDVKSSPTTYYFFLEISS